MDSNSSKADSPLDAVNATYPAISISPLRDAHTISSPSTIKMRGVIEMDGTSEVVSSLLHDNAVFSMGASMSSMSPGSVAPDGP